MSGVNNNKPTGTGYTTNYLKQDGADIFKVDESKVLADIKAMIAQEQKRAGPNGSKQNVSTTEIDKYIAKGLWDPSMEKYLLKEADRIATENEKKQTQTAAQLNRGNVAV